jgi:hypothetical protein
LDDYQAKNNTYSIDGLPGLLSFRKRLGKSIVFDEIKRWIRSVWYGKMDAVLLGWLIGVFIAIVHSVFKWYGGVIQSNLGRVFHTI